MIKYKKLLVVALLAKAVSLASAALAAEVPAVPLNQPSSATTAADISDKNTFNPIVDDKLVVIASGNIAGVYYPASGAICRLFNNLKLSEGTRCTVESTDGSVYNIESLRRGEVEFSMVQSDVQRQAFEATGAFATMPRFENLRFIASLHNEAITIAVRKGSGIEELDKLVGKTINIGNQGSSMRKIFENLMRIKGWNLQTFKGVTEYTPDQQVTMLCKGEIDAMILVTGHPNGAMQDVTNACEVQLIELIGPEIEKFVQETPEFAFTTIPGGMYLGIAKNVRTIGTKATILTTSEMSEQLVYNLTKAIFSQLDKFKKMHPVLSALDAKQMVNEGKTVPMHPGAQRYYQEAGLLGGGG